MSKSTYQDYFRRNHRKRVISWTLLYSAIAILFVAFFIGQTSKINTFQLPTGQLQIQMSKIQYTVGETISFRLTNNFSVPIRLVNKCPKQWLHVFNYNNGQWNQISATTKTSNCQNAGSQIVINPGGSVSENYNNWSGLFSTPGIYRVVVLADNYPSLSYTDFQVIAKPVVLSAPGPIVIYKPVYTPIYVPSSGSGSDGGGSAGSDN